jgi:tetratricopeptide (TPR) repeat protein
LTRVGVKREDFSVAFSLSNVPNIEHFVARDKELAEIHTTLRGYGSRRTVVLHGLGGIGKTQLTVAYAKRHKDKYSAIFWLNIRDEDSLKQSFVKVARQILREHPSASRLSSIDIKENLDEMIDAVKGWLSLPNNTRWLMIYDNYDNPKIAGNADPAAVDIQNFFPESHQGSIIITTRSSQVRIGHFIQIRKLSDVRDSLEILSNVSRREELRSGKNVLHFCNTDLILILDPDAIMLARELDGLPLALATAGAYLDQVAISLSDYLRLYKQSWVQLQESSPELDSYEDRTLYSTWQISFDHVKQQNDLSAKLLCFWAYFDSQDLWLELLQHSDSNDPDWVRELTKDELRFHGAMRVLTNHGLVEVDKSSQELLESRGYSIHGCVHSWTVYVLNQEWDYDLARVAVNSVALHLPGVQALQPWLTQRRLLQHAARCSYIVLNDLLRDTGMEHAYHQLGLLYWSQCKLAEAEQMYQRALQGYEKALGAEHTSTLMAINNLGILYQSQGKLAEAEQMYQRALKGREKALGAEHTLTLDSVHCLGTLYQDQGKLAEAEQMYQRALQGYEKALGADNAATYIPALNTIWNLGALFEDQTDSANARITYSKALIGFEKVVGPDHPSSRSLRDTLRVLDERMHNKALVGVEEPMNNLQRGPSHLGAKGTSQESRRNKLLKKIKFRYR